MSRPRLAAPPPSAVVARWQRNEADVVAAEHARNATKGGDAIAALWDAAFANLDQLMPHHRGQMPFRRVRAALMSMQSAIGNSAERLLHTYGSALAAANTFRPGMHLRAIRSDEQFADAVKALRADAAAGRLDPGDVADAANWFFVADTYLHNLIANPNRPVAYPDTVSAFSDHTGEHGRLVAAEHKLTGANDSKSVPKNLSALDAARTYLHHRNWQVQTVIALTFTLADGSLTRRWRNASPAPDLICFNADVWPALFGVSISADEYDYYLDALAAEAAARAYSSLTGVCPTVDDGAWVWPDEQPVSQTHRWVCAEAGGPYFCLDCSQLRDGVEVGNCLGQRRTLPQTVADELDRERHLPPATPADPRARPNITMPTPIIAIDA